MNGKIPELARSGEPEVPHRFGCGVTPSGAGLRNESRQRVRRGCIERKVRMDIHRDAISAAQPPTPVVNACETFVDRDKRALSSAHTTSLTDDAVRLYITATQSPLHQQLIQFREEGNSSQGPKNSQTFRGPTDYRLIYNTKERYNIPVLGLGNELGEDANVVEPTLGIGHAHDTTEEVDGAEFA